MWGKLNSKDFTFQNKNKKKIQTKLTVADRTVFFFLQEYNMFIISGLRSVFFFTKSFVMLSPLRAPSRSCWRSDYKQALPTKHSRWKRLSSRDQWNLTPATMCRGSAVHAVWSRCFGPRTRPNETTSNFNSHSLDKWSQSRALYYNI